MKKVTDIDLNGSEKVDEILRKMGDSGGCMARNLAISVDIIEEMVKDSSCIKFLSFPAAPIASGMRGVICKMVKERIFDVIITTSGTLDHDLARIWEPYFEGFFEMDDYALFRKKIHRLGNILVSQKSYGVVLEEKLQPFFESLYKEGVRELSSAELCERLGEFADSKTSILYWASRNRIPVFVPGLTDGAVGSQLWMFSQRHRDFKIDLLKDENQLSETIFEAKRTGALIVGGGISKHHTLWWNQFKGGLDYAVSITIANEFDGSLSGAPIREAVSWGKVNEKARKVSVWGEATTLMPFILVSLLDRMKNR